MWRKQIGNSVLSVRKIQKKHCNVPQNQSGQMLELDTKTLADNIVRFGQLGCMPLALNIERLDEGSGIEQTFVSEKARWHKSCNTKFNITKLRRAEKRYSTEEQSSGIGKKFTRSNTGSEAPPNINRCFFCDECERWNSPLHNASTFGLDARVRKYAAVFT